MNKLIIGGEEIYQVCFESNGYCTLTPVSRECSYGCGDNFKEAMKDFIKMNHLDGD